MMQLGLLNPYALLTFNFVRVYNWERTSSMILRQIVRKYTLRMKKIEHNTMLTFLSMGSDLVKKLQAFP